MVYVTRYQQDVDRDEILDNLKSPSKDLGLEQIREYTVGDFVKGNGEDAFINGKLSVRRIFTDKQFRRTQDYDIETEEKEETRYDEVGFTIYPDMEVVAFSSKKKAKKFGRSTLSRILFGNSDELKSIAFYPEKVLQAKKEGEFKNVWYNGVKNSGNVDYTQQHGTDIDQGSDFMAGEERPGIGVEFRSRYGRDIKIAVYETGSLVKKGKMNTMKGEATARKEMIDKCLEYSDYNSPTSDVKTGMRDLTDF